MVKFVQILPNKFILNKYISWYYELPLILISSFAQFFYPVKSISRKNPVDDRKTASKILLPMLEKAKMWKKIDYVERPITLAKAIDWETNWTALILGVDPWWNFCATADRTVEKRKTTDKFESVQASYNWRNWLKTQNLREI